MEAETPPPHRRARTRARIRTAALELFSERGFVGASMRDLATRVGCTAAALYYHYEGKDALLADIVRPFLDDAEAVLPERDGHHPVHDPGLDSPVAGGMRETLAAYLDCLLEHADVVRLIQLDVAVRGHPEVAPRHDDLARRLQARLAGGQGGAEATARVSASLGALRGPLLRADLDPVAVREVILDAALRALDAPAGDGPSEPAVSVSP